MVSYLVTEMVDCGVLNILIASVEPESD